MDIHFHAAVISDDQRRLVELWAADNHADDIESIAVHDRLVSVHGSRDQFAAAAGTTIRRDDLAAELSAALTNMRNIAVSPPGAPDARH